jgi:hypothetical protein
VRAASKLSSPSGDGRWHAEISRATNIRAEFDVVIALNLAPVVDKLELVFILNQGQLQPLTPRA